MDAREDGSLFYGYTDQIAGAPHLWYVGLLETWCGGEPQHTQEGRTCMHTQVRGLRDQTPGSWVRTGLPTWLSLYSQFKHLIDRLANLSMMNLCILFWPFLVEDDCCCKRNKNSTCTWVVEVNPEKSEQPPSSMVRALHQIRSSSVISRPRIGCQVYIFVLRMGWCSLDLLARPRLIFWFKTRWPEREHWNVKF